MVSYEVVTGITRTPLVGAYLPPSMLEHLPELEEYLQRFREPIAFGGLNVDLEESRSSRSQRVFNLLVEYGLIDLVRNFRQKFSFYDLKTWPQVRQGTVLGSRCDYILGMDRHSFELLGIRDMCSYLSDHFMLRAWLLQLPTRCHDQYFWGRRAFLLRTPPNRVI